MSSASLVLDHAAPLSVRLFDRIPLPAFFGGIAVGLGVFAFFLVYTALFGAGPGQLAGVAFAHGWAAELLQDLFLGFAVAVVAASLRGAREELEALRPALLPPLRDEADLARRVMVHPRLPLALVTLFAVLSAVATVATPSMWVDGRMPGWTNASVLWIFARNCVAWSIALRGMVLELVGGLRFSRLAEHVAVVELDGSDVFAPFVRRALRNVSLWMLLTVFMALNFAGRGWAIPSLLWLGIIVLLAFAVTAFLLPLLGPRKRLRECKRAELLRVREALRVARDRVLEAPASDLAGGRLADLVAWETRVANASEWPIAASTVVRFSLYLALGLGSWVGAGIVQHGLESALR